jgi:hypothetical protein
VLLIFRSNSQTGYHERSQIQAEISKPSISTTTTITTSLSGTTRRTLAFDTQSNHLLSSKPPTHPATPTLTLRSLVPPVAHVDMECSVIFWGARCNPLHLGLLPRSSISESLLLATERFNKPPKIDVGIYLSCPSDRQLPQGNTVIRTPQIMGDRFRLGTLCL